MSKTIQSEEQYEAAQRALIDIASKLDDPLNELSEAEIAKQNAIYDRTTELMLLYRRGQNVKEFPEYYKPKYDQAGWAYQSS